MAKKESFSSVQGADGGMHYRNKCGKLTESDLQMPGKPTPENRQAYKKGGMVRRGGRGR